MPIAIVGSGYVGLVAAACFAELGHHVICVDNDRGKLSALQAGQTPIHEKFLPELLARHRGQRLTFSDSLADAVRRCDVIFIAVGTPAGQDGSCDLSYVESVSCEIARSVNGVHNHRGASKPALGAPDKIVVEKSTVPVCTSDWIRKAMLLNGAPAGSFAVVSNPEFLREGSAVSDFLYPDRIVIGADDERCARVLGEIYRPLTDGSYYRQKEAVPGPDDACIPPRLIVTSAKSAELIKHASNAFLAMKISFINAVATICEAVGANIEQVCEGIGADSRIGHRFLSPGIGYGGSCFPKDLKAFRAVARECGYDFRLLQEVIDINSEQCERFLRKVRSALWNLRGKRLGVLGLAFKGGTDDIRESPALNVIQALLEDGAEVVAYDPAAVSRAQSVLPERGVTYVGSVYQAAEGMDALLILTDWEEFADLDLGRIQRLLRYPIIIDGRNLYSPELMAEMGFIYMSVGRPDMFPKNPAELRSKAS